MAHRTRKPSAILAFLVGLLIFLGARYWQDRYGHNLDAAERLYFNFFEWVLGFGMMLGGAIRAYQNWLQNERRKEAEQPSEVFGAAAFATSAEAGAAGLHDPKGLYIGLLDGRPLFFGGKAHLLTVAPARKGKGIGFVIPNLLHFQGSAFVTDPKGELAAITSRHRRETFGQDVYVLNPWKLHGLPSHRYNPLAPLLAAVRDPAKAKGVMDEVRALALQLVPEPEDTRNKYFRDGTRQILRGVMLHLATGSEPARCILPEAWRIVSNQKMLLGAIDEMRQSGVLEGVLASIGEDLSQTAADLPDNFQSFRTSAAEALDIFDPSGWLGEAVSGSDVDFRVFKERPVTVYLIIPQEQVAAYGRWLGLLSRQAITAVATGEGATPVLFLLDEFANMGKLAGLAESLTALPGLGVRVWAFVQELADLERVYGPNTTQTLLSQAEVKQFFAVASDRLAKVISEALGERTVKTHTINLGKYLDDDIGESLGEVGRRLLAPDQIRQMGSDEQLLFINQLPPVRAKRPPFWFFSPWQEWAGRNPLEGPFPQPEPVVTLRYREKGRGR